MRAPLPLLLAAVLLTACTSTATRPPAEGAVRLRRVAFVGGPKVRPVAIVEDSRCPRDVACFQAGRVIVRVEITTGAGVRSSDLTLGEWVPVADGRLSLVGVTPAQRTNHPVRPSTYRFTFQFQGGL